MCCSPRGHKESDTTEWVNWTELLRRVLLLDSKEIKPINLKGNQPWILIGRTEVEAEAPVFWSFDLNSQLSGKVPDAGKDWRQKEKRASEDEMVGWHHQCNGHELGQTLGDGEGQRGLARYSPWGRKDQIWLGTEQQCSWKNIFLLITKHVHCHS